MTGYVSKKLLGAARLPDTPSARAYLDKVLDDDDDTQVYKKPWVEPTGNEWFEWWRLSTVADETEAEIDFADFLIIAQAVVAKLKEKNNG